MLVDRRLPSSRSLSLGVSLLTLLALFALAPLTRPGFPQTAAGFRPIWDLTAPAGPTIGPLPAGWLPLNAARLARAAGAAPGDAVKIVMGLGYLLGGIGVYLWLRRRWDEPAALLAGVVYLFLPYRLAILYVAGEPGEVWALGLYPWVGWAGEAFVRRPRLGRALSALLAWALLLASHAGLAVCAALGFGLALSLACRSPWGLAFFAPALPVALWGILTGSAGDFHSHYPYLFQLFSASWNAAPSGPGWINEMPFQLGVIPLGLAGLALFWPSPHPLSQSAGKRPGARAVLALGILLACLLALSLSAPLWRLTRLDRILGAPWQMLGFAGLGLALLAGALVRRARSLATPAGLAGLMVINLVAVYAYLAPAWSDIPPRLSPVYFGDRQIALADYRVIGKVYPGAQVQVNVTWQCLGRLDKDYTVFVQALDSAQKIRGQQDTQPRAGARPTSAWQPGQIITDTYIIEVAPAAPESTYALNIGFYDWQTGARLPAHWAAGQDDKFNLLTPEGNGNGEK